MVLGLGSRSKKDRVPIISQLVELELHLHEIKPWLGLVKPPKTPVPVALGWGRGGRLIGNSRNVTSTTKNCPEAGKISLSESFRIAVAPNREVLKKAKKSYPDLEDPVIFTLIDTDDPKGKPLAQAALDLSSLASITEPKLVAVPFTISKKVAKGPTCYLHLTVQKYQDDRPSSPAASASLGTSGRTSDASSQPPLDEDTQQKLVAALLSDSEDNRSNKEEEIDSFTDDDNEDMKEFRAPVVPQGLSSSHGNGALKSPQQNATASVASLPTGNAAQGASISLVQEVAEVQKQSGKTQENVPRQAIASHQASPVKAAAIAAAAAYTKKYSFLPRHTDSFTNESDNSSSDLDSAGEDEFPSRFSKTAQARSLVKGSSNAAGYLQVDVSSANVSNTYSSALEKGTKKETQKMVEEQIYTKDAGNMLMVEDVKSKLNGQHSVSTKTGGKTMQETKVVSEKRMGFAEKSESTGETISTAGVVLNPSSSVKECNVTSMASRSGSEASLIPENGLQRSLNNENDFSQKAETTPAKVPVGAERDATSRTQAMQFPERKPKPSVQVPLRDRAQQKSTMSQNPEPPKGRTNQTSANDSRAPMKGMQDGKAKMLKSSDCENEEAKQKSMHAEGKGPSMQSKIQQMEAEIEKLKGELTDVAAVEAALYSTTAEHGSSSMKLHAPARRLARMYRYCCKHCSPERRASCARTTMSGLVLTARACGNDVARLTFWWSNTAVLREIISTPSKSLPAANPHFSIEEKNTPNSHSSKTGYQKQRSPSAGQTSEDWRELSTFITGLERLESWIYTKVVESIWWQVLTPQMQQPEKQAILDIEDNDVTMRPSYRNCEKGVTTRETEDARQGNVSVEIWKKAFRNAYERLCPVRVLGVECGCLPMLNRLVLEACVGRLDVAMFNAILRDDEVPTDPISDPISDVRVLPIPNSSLSFGRGAQLKNAVATLSSFVSNLTKKAGDVMSEGNSDDDEQNVISFPLLKAMGGLLMLPKDMLIDKSLRKEVCPTLELLFIARILSKFQPDEFSSETITPELLNTINAEVGDEEEDMYDNGNTARIALSSAVAYNPPQSSIVRHWIGDMVSSESPLRRSNSSILRKGHTSDDEIDELESPISWLWDNTMGSNRHSRSNNAPGGAVISPNDGGGIRRFMLLREVWSSR